MSARPIGEIINGIVARCEAMMGFQQMLSLCDTDAGKKNLIMEAWERGAITRDDAQILIEAYRIEEA